MTLQEQNRLYATDIHPSDCSRFIVGNYEILIQNNALGEALLSLTKEKRDILLLAFFLDMTDDQIATCLGGVRRTICYQRMRSLKQMKDYLEKNGYGKPHKKEL